MRNHKRDGKITFFELLLLAGVFFFGYWVIIAPMTKTDDMVKEEWVRNNLDTIYDAIGHLQKDESFVLEEMTLNEVDILRSKWERSPLKWPRGVLFDSFKAETNKLSIVVHFSNSTNVVTYVNLPQE